MWLFQLYFYRNLVTLLSDSQILNEDELNKGTIEKLLTEIFTLDEQENEQKVEKFDKGGGEIYRVSYPDSNNNFDYWNEWLRTEYHILLKSKM